MQVIACRFIVHSIPYRDEVIVTRIIQLNYYGRINFRGNNFPEREFPEKSF